ncbi:hypothetical protein VPH35_057162 [Triticum aestivum]
MNTLQQYFLPVDVEEIVKIKACPRLGNDVLAWSPERSGTFTVRSAYQLTLNERLRPSSVAASRAPDGRRAVWALLWRCPRAVALWQAMASHWKLPDVRKIAHTGPEWLLNTIGDISETERLHLLMTLWRCWHVRNEIVHNKKPPDIESSRRFLLSYVKSLVAIQQHPTADQVKGKMVTDADQFSNRSSRADAVKEAPLRWTPPPPGWTTLSVDGSYCEHDRTAGTGMVLRDEGGDPIFSSCRELRSCHSPLEAEIAACREGISLALQWTTLPIIVETDCLEVVRTIQSTSRDRSVHAMMIEDTKILLHEGREFIIKHIKREQNSVSHFLANFGRTEKRTAVWLRSGPREVPDLCKADMFVA